MAFTFILMHDSTSFQKIVKDYLEESCQQHPVLATSLGFHQWDDQLPQMDPQFLQRNAHSLKNFEKRLTQEVAFEKLSQDEQMDYLAMAGQIQSELLDLEKFRWHEKLPSVYLDPGFYGIFLLLIQDFAPLPERAPKILGRLQQLPRLLHEGSQQIQKAPRLYIEIGIEMTLNGRLFLKQVIPALAQQVPQLSSELESALKEANLALDAFLAFQEVMKETSRETFAAGETLFLEKLRAEFQMEISCQSLVEQAEEAIAQIREELEKTKRQLNHNGNLTELFSSLKKQTPAQDQILKRYQEMVQQAKECISKNYLAPLSPKESLEVVPTPEFERATTPYAAYVPPAPFDSLQKGFFWVTPVDEAASQAEKLQQLQGHCLAGIPVTVAHEAYPGHHLQLSFTNQLSSLFRRANSNTMACEGWAHYCEQLMDEVGFYQEISSRIFYLRDALWRACRVIVDVGLHTQGMSVGDAIHFLIEEAFLEPANAVAEVKRYTLSPTQPLCYLIGKQEILRLREEYKKKRGSSFTLYDFHERFLKASSLPLPLIRRELLEE